MLALPVFLSTVTPGKLPTFWLRPVNALNSELFPLFGFPTSAILIDAFFVACSIPYPYPDKTIKKAKL
jgi:hypothetical protein